MTNMQEQVDEAIKYTVDSWDEKKRNLVSHRLEYLRAVSALQKLNISSIWYDGALHLGVIGDTHALAALMGAMRKGGFEPGTRPQAGATTYITTWTHQSSGAVIGIGFSSTVCRRVQVGTRTVEEPIYEIVCNETTPAVA